MNNELKVSGIVLSGIISALILIPLFGADTTIFLTQNGSGNSTDTTVCTNLGSVGEGIVATSSGGDCDFKKLLGGTGISLSSNGTRITVTNSLPDNTICSNIGQGVQIYKDGECVFRTLTEGSNIDLTQNTHDISIAVTGITSESTACNNVRAGNQLCSGGNVNVDTLIAGTGITIT